MTRKRVWKEVTTFSMSNYDHNYIEDVIKNFEELAKQYPKARIVERFEDYADYKVISVQVERDETDAEMQKRETEEAVQAERNRAYRLAQFEALQKEFGGKQ
jgi:hypothetical protein